MHAPTYAETLVHVTNGHLHGYANAEGCAKWALRCWEAGNWTPARAWARRTVECLPKGTEVRKRAEAAAKAVAVADRLHPHQGPAAQELLLSVLRQVERAYWQLWGAQPAPDNWFAL